MGMDSRMAISGVEGVVEGTEGESFHIFACECPFPLYHDFFLWLLSVL